MKELLPFRRDADEKTYFSVQNDMTDRLIGHMRFDFGRNGSEFYHSWWPGTVADPDFSTEFNGLITALRQTVMKDKRSLAEFCTKNNIKELTIIPIPSRGFVLETERYEYHIRFCPSDYSYIYCYRR